MASFHLSVKTVKRSAGRSATAAAAYRHAVRLECHREGRVHDYTRKQGVEDSFIVAPDEAPEWAQDRAALWNAAEAREVRKDAVVAREWELALPHELGADGRRALAKGFARELVGRYGLAADVAIHAPHREGDGRNWHAHVLTTTRRLTAAGLTDKTKALDSRQTGGPEITLMRERWAEMQNHALERHALAERVSHRTLHAQREAALSRGDERRAEELDRSAEVKLGPVVGGIERKEQRDAERHGRRYEPLTERGALVHEARAARALLEELAHVRDRLRESLRERTVLARETYAHAREDGATHVRAGLAALRAAVERHGLGEQGHGLAHGLDHGRDEEQERDRQQRHRAEPESIKERLGRILGREAARDEETARTVARTPERTPAPKYGVASAREELERLRAEEASRTPRTHEAIREELERLRERESRRAHEVTRERLNEALGRMRDTEREVDQEEVPTHKGTTHGRDDDGHGWGL